MIIYSVVSKDGKVFAHNSSSDFDMIAEATPIGFFALVGRHVDFGETVGDEYTEFMVPGTCEYSFMTDKNTGSM